jgi:hypothetical protein
MIERCDACGRDCSTGESCIFPQIQFSDGKTVNRLRYVGETRCNGCGVTDGGIHHFDCPNEICPRCEGKFVTCRCMEDAPG